MTWTNNDFRAYPVRCFTAHREAALTLQPYVIGAWPHRSEAAAAAVELRKFRYLVRANPGTDLSMDKLMAEYTYRTKTSINDFGDAILTLTAAPNVVQTLESWNPELLGIFSD